MKISSGHYDVIDSGQVISFNDESVFFDLGPELNVTFKFGVDTEKTDFRVDVSITGPTQLILNCVNPNDAGLKFPIKVGNIGLKNVYVIFWITNLTVSSVCKKIEYTWYLGKEENAS
jgi:hypothetical protein